MVHITLANAKIIIYSSTLNKSALRGKIYKIPIYFFSNYEKQALLAIQELLKYPTHYFTEIYKPYKPKDTHKYIYEGNKPSFHKYKCCPKLNADYQNYEIPPDIIEQGYETVKLFREWFKENKNVYNINADIFAVRLHARWGILTNPKAIQFDNSGSTKTMNYSIEKLEEKIDKLIKEAGRYYYSKPKNKEILSKFSKKSFLARQKGAIRYNNTQYTDKEVKELLKIYVDRFKKPLKSLLIEYYRLQLNPDIKMEGTLLYQLGFSQCRHCYAQKYKPSGINKIDKSGNIENLNDDLEIINEPPYITNNNIRYKKLYEYLPL